MKSHYSRFVLIAAALLHHSTFAFDALLTDDSTLAMITKPANMGSYPTLNVDAGHYALLKFDLSLIPPGDQVSVATLTVFINKVAKPGAISLFTVNGNWSEEAVPQVTFTGLAGSPVAIVPANARNSFVRFDVTTLVKNWLNGSTNDGVALGVDGSGPTANIALDSKENIAGGHCAALHIELADGVPGPAGPQGPPGPQGRQGPQGPPGSNQVNLSSTNLLAVATANDTNAIYFSGLTTCIPFVNCATNKSISELNGRWQWNPGFPSYTNGTGYGATEGTTGSNWAITNSIYYDLDNPVIANSSTSVTGGGWTDCAGNVIPAPVFGTNSFLAPVFYSTANGSITNGPVFTPVVASGNIIQPITNDLSMSAHLKFFTTNLDSNGLVWYDQNGNYKGGLWNWPNHNGTIPEAQFDSYGAIAIRPNVNANPCASVCQMGRSGGRTMTTFMLQRDENQDEMDARNTMPSLDDGISKNPLGHSALLTFASITTNSVNCYAGLVGVASATNKSVSYNGQDFGMSELYFYSDAPHPTGFTQPIDCNGHPGFKTAIMRTNAWEFFTGVAIDGFHASDEDARIHWPPNAFNTNQVLLVVSNTSLYALSTAWNSTAWAQTNKVAGP